MLTLVLEEDQHQAKEKGPIPSRIRRPLAKTPAHFHAGGEGAGRLDSLWTLCAVLAGALDRLLLDLVSDLGALVADLLLDLPVHLLEVVVVLADGATDVRSLVSRRAAFLT